MPSLLRGDRGDVGLRAGQPGAPGPAAGPRHHAPVGAAGAAHPPVSYRRGFGTLVDTQKRVILEAGEGAGVAFIL